MSRVNKYFHLPLSGQIVGIIFNTLQIPYPDHIQKDIQRYFRGERIHEDTRKEIFWLIANKIVKDEVLPYPKVFDDAFCLNEDGKSGLHIQIVNELKSYSVRWDNICAKIHAWRIPVNRKEEILVTIFRLLIIDLAVRNAALCHLMKINTIDEAIPMWAKEGAGSSFLKSLKIPSTNKESQVSSLSIIFLTTP